MHQRGSELHQYSHLKSSRLTGHFPEPQHVYSVEPAELDEFRRYLSEESLASAKGWEWSRCRREGQRPFRQLERIESRGQSLAVKASPARGTSGAPRKDTISEPVQVAGAPAGSRKRAPPTNGAGGCTEP